MLYNWTTARGTRQIQAAGVVLVGAPESIAIARQARAVLEALAAAQRQGYAPIEVASQVSVSRAAGAPIEALTGVRRQARTAIERRATRRPVVADSGGGVRVRTGRPPFTPPPRARRVSRHTATAVEVLGAVARRAQTELDVRVTPVIEFTPLEWLPLAPVILRRAPMPAVAWRPTVPVRVRVPAGAHRRSRAVREAELLGCIDAGVL